jgi:hypothetical protein
LEAVFKEEVDAALEQDRLIVPDLQVYPLRHVQLFLRHEIANQLRHPQGILLAGTEDVEEDRRVTIVAGVEVFLLEGVHHLRDVAELNHRAVGPGNHRDRFDVRGFVAAVLGTDQDFARFGPHRAPRQVDRGRAHGVRHLLEGQAVFLERVL